MLPSEGEGEDSLRQRTLRVSRPAGYEERVRGGPVVGEVPDDQRMGVKNKHISANVVIQVGEGSNHHVLLHQGTADPPLLPGPTDAAPHVVDDVPPEHRVVRLLLDVVQQLRRDFRNVSTYPLHFIVKILHDET